ncbi:MAG TPA: HAMP domain-containing sensor histidine kinase [Verrucomicrobiae bacterium]|nr:HAMP domain-containing sensor histidine kinase [Verrucomicrobiae bacterium]
MRRFSLFHRRVGQDVRAWPMLALLVIVVAVAIGCVLWFMREAVQNERMAVREELAEAYRSHLALVQAQLLKEWDQRLARLDGVESNASGFARGVREGLADSVIIIDREGRAIYPSDALKRSVEANTELLALESSTNRSSDAFARLQDRLNDYGADTLPSAQRRFLMHELRRMDPSLQFPTLAAEELAARYVETNPAMPNGTVLRPTPLSDVWTVASPNGRMRALFTTAGLKTRLGGAIRESALPKGVSIAVLSPGEEAMSDSTIATMSLSPTLPGWRLSLSLDNRAQFDTEAERRVGQYFAIGSVVIAATLVLAIFMARGFGRQVQLARLKNDLVANVSHELKTPLTAMRALVDTLLDTERFDEKTTREYLKLLATENARLSRLIDNFLTFSRLERNKFKFAFARVSPQRIVEGAVAAMGERAHAPGCRVETRVAAGIPEIEGDADALTTALLNLLDNAWKYSGDDKRIVVRAEARDGHVEFAVEDNGIGLSSPEQRRVFRRFYQSDQRLARTVGGCGLGLSIVQSIVEAHHGAVRVESEVGRGSTFIMEIPAVAESAS